VRTAAQVHQEILDQMQDSHNIKGGVSLNSKDLNLKAGAVAEGDAASLRYRNAHWV
jgi:hypothetical protein